MIPIDKRIDMEEKREYISMVFSRIANRTINDMQYAIGKLLNEISIVDLELYKRIQSEISIWKNELSVKEISVDQGIRKLTSVLADVCAWIVMPYELMCDMYRRIQKFSDTTKNDLKSKFECCKNRYTNTFSKYGINKWIVKTTGIQVCPYCNLSYTYNRTSQAASAQLDHFYNKSDYPMFALCYYNLIPSCYACNHIKSDSDKELVSPYADRAFEHMKISWTLKPKTDEKVPLLEMEENISIQIESTIPEENNNLKEMNIIEAYQNHKDYAAEVVKKIMIYNNPQTKKLISSAFKNENINLAITDEEFERLYFGNYMNKEDQGKRILCKLARDFYNSTKNHPN